MRWSFLVAAPLETWIMSRINLEDLAKQHPDYERALRVLQSWIDAQDQERVINPTKVAKDLREVDTTDLAIAFTLLLKAGLLRRVYKVLTDRKSTRLNSSH